MYYKHRPEKQNRRGSGKVGIVLSPKAQRAWEMGGFKPIVHGGIIGGTTRLIGIHLAFLDENDNLNPIFVMSAYHPSTLGNFKKDIEQNEKNMDEFAVTYNGILSTINKDVPIFIGSDINCKIGTNTAGPEDTIGSRSVTGNFRNPENNEKGHKV
mmetsp:Transcript_49707/g.60110  ORF Transcript_49707/g.60110 Transcript_49707/m.60110 type:complete len:155 (+) Transcript_49707:2-466(+)